MGNCLKSPTSDDISLLHESQSDRASYGDGAEPDQEPPPPYQVGEGAAARPRWGWRGSRGRSPGGRPAAPRGPPPPRRRSGTGRPEPLPFRPHVARGKPLCLGRCRRSGRAAGAVPPAGRRAGAARPVPRPLLPPAVTSPSGAGTLRDGDRGPCPGFVRARSHRSRIFSSI